MPRARRTPLVPGTKTQTLYLRNAPEKLIDRVRMVAAKRKTTMEYVCLRAMELGLPGLEAESTR